MQKRDPLLVGSTCSAPHPSCEKCAQLGRGGDSEPQTRRNPYLTAECLDVAVLQHGQSCEIQL